MVTLLWLVLVVSPLWRPHVAAVSIPLVLVIALYRPPLRPLLVAGVVAVPLVVWQLDGLLVTGNYRGTEAELVAALEQLPEGAWVISDEPGVVWRAGRRTTDDLVDPSMLRRQQDRYTEESLARDAEDPRVCAFIRISEQRFAHFPGLPDELAARGYVADPDVAPFGVTPKLWQRTCELAEDIVDALVDDEGPDLQGAMESASSLLELLRPHV